MRARAGETLRRLPTLLKPVTRRRSAATPRYFSCDTNLIEPDPVQTIDSNLVSVGIPEFRSSAFDAKLPIVIRNRALRASGDPSSKPSLHSIAAGAGIPAIEKWFTGNNSLSAADNGQSFETDYLSTFGHTILPYELVTPAFHEASHLVAERAIADLSTLSISKCLPGGTLTLSSLLEKGQQHALQQDTDGSVQHHVDSLGDAAVVNVRPGKPLTKVQLWLLQSYGGLFQEFHSFSAPLALLFEAARVHDGQTARTALLSGLYIAQAQIADLPLPLQDDLPLPSLLHALHSFEPIPRPVDIYGANVWLGVPPTFTPLHKDPNPNLFVQMAGQKAVRLLSPDRGAHLFRKVQSEIGVRAGRGAIRGAEMMQGVEREALRKAVWEKTTAGLQHALLAPGDALFIPKGWWHSIRSEGYEMNASVNWWFR